MQPELEDPHVKKGKEFEEFVLTKFDKNYFKFKVWRSDKWTAGYFPESNTYPDLEFDFHCYDYKTKFAIKCKYRSNYNAEHIELCRQDQLKNYKNFQYEKDMEVYVVLGVGGKASRPDELYVIPLNSINNTTFHKKELQNYYKSVNKDFFYNRNIHRLT